MDQVPHKVSQATELCQTFQLHKDTAKDGYSESNSKKGKSELHYIKRLMKFKAPAEQHSNPSAISLVLTIYDQDHYQSVRPMGT